MCVVSRLQQIYRNPWRACETDGNATRSNILKAMHPADFYNQYNFDVVYFAKDESDKIHAAAVQTGEPLFCDFIFIFEIFKVHVDWCVSENRF